MSAAEASPRRPSAVLLDAGRRPTEGTMEVGMFARTLVGTDRTYRAGARRLRSGATGRATTTSGSSGDSQHIHEGRYR